MDAIGIYISGESWKAAHLRKGLREITPVEHMVLEGDLSERIERLKSYMSKKRLGPGSVSLALPSRLCLVKTLSLPSADKKSLTAILGYEIERHIPNRPESWLFTHQLSGEAEGAPLVTLLAVRASDAAEAAAVFSSAGLEAGSVISGQWAFAKAAVRSGFLPGDVLSAVISVSAEGLSVDFFKKGALVYSSQAGHEDAAMELGCAISFLREAPEVVFVVDEDGGGKADTVVHEAGRFCSSVRLLGPLPSLSRAFGAALVALEGGANLISSPGAPASRKKILGAALSAVIAVLATGAFVTASDYLEIRRTEKEIALLGDGRTEAEALMKQVGKIDSDLRTLEDLKGSSSTGFLDTLVRLTELTPEDTYLTGLEYGKDSISVNGVSMKASGLFMKLSRSGFADEIRYDGPVIRGRDGRERFRITFKPSGGKAYGAVSLDS